jgi:hypothetical protein
MVSRIRAIIVDAVRQSRARAYLIDIDIIKSILRIAVVLLARGETAYSERTVDLIEAIRML